MNRVGMLLLVCALLGFASVVRAAPAASSLPDVARFALIIGVNQGYKSNAATLRYADDDAARYLELFRSLGARSYLLSRLDENTRRLNPQAAAEALTPNAAELERSLRALTADLERARQRHVRTIVYFVYAGHGTLEDGRGYISLEDAQLGEAELEAFVDRLKADQTHFIVDACYSYFLAAARGPGGQRRPAEGFSRMSGLAARRGVGLLLSTSSARESHEWSAFEAGVFSHEVRSGLYGAADADGDGQVSYQEIAGFVQRANAAVPSERFRPDVFARAPSTSGTLIDLREGLRRRVHVPGGETAHYLLEDTRGVRLADFHNAAGQELSILRPPGLLYLRRVEGDQEVVLPAAPDVIELAELEPQPSQVRARGAANDVYDALFTLPFGRADVVPLAASVSQTPLSDARPASRPAWRTATGGGLVALGVLGATGGALTLLSAKQLKSNIPGDASQRDISAYNARISTRNQLAGVELGAGAAALSSGLLLLFWPSGAEKVALDAGAGQATVHFRGTF